MSTLASAVLPVRAASVVTDSSRFLLQKDGKAGLNRSGFDRDSFPWKDRVRYGEAISEGAQGAG
ncbi:hypothetical protein ACIA74_45110, partial [Streptomyces sp. NPDC051658]|uniref:hypothetical protein n=1 Tax=Streptomyces sp. NPDC051658 TaxID=3365667 RepID=UPI003790CAD8